MVSGPRGHRRGRVEGTTIGAKAGRRGRPASCIRECALITAHLTLTLAHLALLAASLLLRPLASRMLST